MSALEDAINDSALFQGLARHFVDFRIWRQENGKELAHKMEAVFSAAGRGEPKGLEQFRRLAQEIIEVGEQIHGKPRPSEPVPLYYIQDTRSFIGNCVVFWGPDGNGYTTDLRRAGKYSFEEAMRQHFMRETDLPWLCDEIDTLRRATVDQQDMRSRSTQQASLRRKATQRGIVRD